MSLVYRLMGMVALLNQRLSRTRINLIPLNWAAMIGLGILIGAAVNELHDASANGATPRPVSVATLLAQPSMDKNYVAVQGLLVPDAGFDEKEDGGSTVEHTWVPMVDVQGKQAFLVERASAGGGGQPAQTIVTGMLRPIDSELRTKAQEGGGNIDGVPLSLDYMLVEGQHPGSAVLWGSVAALASLLLALFVITFLTKYVVFQKVPLAPGRRMEGADVDPDQGANVRVTGSFLLDGQNAQRFLDVPAGYGALETGEIAFVSNIDASKRFMGMTTSSRRGLWTVILQNGSARVLDHGLLYSGFSVRPALRLDYREAATGKPGQAILSFGTEGERTHVLRMIEAVPPAVA